MDESIHVRFDAKLGSEKSKLVEKLADLEITLAGSDEKTKASEEAKKQSPDATEASTIQKKSRSRPNIYEDLIMGNKDEPVKTRPTFKVSEETPLGLVSLIEPTSCDEALLDKN